MIAGDGVDDDPDDDADDDANVVGTRDDVVGIVPSSPTSPLIANHVVVVIAYAQ
jgi:hypothetical protein